MSGQEVEVPETVAYALERLRFWQRRQAKLTNRGMHNLAYEAGKRTERARVRLAAVTAAEGKR